MSRLQADRKSIHQVQNYCMPLVDLIHQRCWYITILNPRSFVIIHSPPPPIPLCLISPLYKVPQSQFCLSFNSSHRKHRTVTLYLCVSNNVWLVDTTFYLWSGYVTEIWLSILKCKMFEIYSYLFHCSYFLQRQSAPKSDWRERVTE